VITGHWEDHSSYTGNFRAHFINDSNLLKCPIHPSQSQYVCHDLPKGSFVPFRKFVSENCELDEFRPLQFLSLLRNRRLLFGGDSVIGQQFFMIFCSLFDVVETKYTWELKEYRFIGEVFFPEYNATMIIKLYLLEHLRKGETLNLLDHYISVGKLFSPTDMLISNFGLMFNHPEWMKPYLDRWITDLESISVKERPIILWRETTTQHFPPPIPPDNSIPEGFFSGFIHNQSCRPLTNLLTSYEQDYRNRLVIPRMIQARIPIMRVYNITATQFDQHLETYPREQFVDCTHFCAESGVLYYFRDLLYNILPLLIEEKERYVKSFEKKFGISG
jgi:hypothetical protein